MKKRRQEDDDEWTEESEKPKQRKTKQRKKPLNTPKKQRVKKNAVTLVKQAPVAKNLAPRLRRLNSLQAYSALEIITAANCVSFIDPAGCTESDSRGCKSATITLGPKKSFGQMGTDAKGVLPNALADAKKKYPIYDFKSGHVINADFGGNGSDPANMTILTSSANRQQTKFDSNVKDARDYLHKAYQQMRLGNPKSQKKFFDDLKYGIKVEIVMSDDSWAGHKGLGAGTYPDNCISVEMTLQATVVGRPSEDDLRGELTDDLKEGIIKKITSYMDNVQNKVDTANTRNLVDNRP